MSFWNLIGLPSKKNVESLQHDINEIRVQIEALTRVVAKNEQIVQLSDSIEGINRTVVELKESNNNISKQVQDVEVVLNEKLKIQQRELEHSYSNINTKMQERNTQSFKEMKNELEDMGILLKALAMQGIIDEIDQIVK